MSYSFREELSRKLPEGHSLIRLYSVGETETNVETRKGTVKYTFTMTKADISPLFDKPPVVSLGANPTYNQLYASISDLYSLGLVEGVDYYNTKKIDFSQTTLFMELPVLKDSYAFYGTIRCYAVQDDFGGNNSSVQRDLTQVDMSEGIAALQVRNYLVGKLFTFSDPMFIEDRLSIGFIDHISALSQDELDSVSAGLLRNELIHSTIVDNFNDGISDLLLLQSGSNELSFLRYHSDKGDKPVINNSRFDLEIDDSKELAIDDTVSSSENPGQGKGDILTGEQSEHPNSSTEGELEVESDIEIDII